MKNIINSDMIMAMRVKNTVTRDILRVLKGEIERNEQSGKGKVELSDMDIIKIIKKLIDNIKLSGEDNGEIAVLEAYLPKQLTEEEIETLVSAYIESQGITSMMEMGKIMGHFKQNFDGSYDGKVLSNIVKDQLL